MTFCCCNLSETKACFTCPNSMAGIGERYPAPYYVMSYRDIDNNTDEDLATEEQVAPA